MRHMLIAGFSVSRVANTHPADPPPATTTSNSISNLPTKKTLLPSRLARSLHGAGYASIFTRSWLNALAISRGPIMKIVATISALALMLASTAAAAADYPAPKQGEWIARDFKFHTGEMMSELKLHYTTVGAPNGTPVVVLHGTGGSAASVLTPAFAGELFGPGQPLDGTKYYVIIPDALGHGESAKPSDGLKMRFPHYDYADMVDAQYRLLSEGLAIPHVRLIIGNSMGG